MMLNKSCSEPNQISEDNQTSEVIVQQFNSLCIMFDWYQKCSRMFNVRYL